MTDRWSYEESSVVDDYMKEPFNEHAGVERVYGT